MIVVVLACDKYTHLLRGFSLRGAVLGDQGESTTGKKNGKAGG